MTIHVQVKNLRSDANAIIAVVTRDTYKNDGVLTEYNKVVGHLKGGEQLETYVTSSQELSVIETKNG